MTRRRDMTTEEAAARARLDHLLQNGSINVPAAADRSNPETGNRHIAGRTLLEPARCTATIPEDFLTNPFYVAEPKPDGSRYVLYIGDNVDPYGVRPLNALLSRYVGVRETYVDRTGNVPQITGVRYAREAQGTILDGEIIGKNFSVTQKLMGSSASECVRKQTILGQLHYVVWDVPFYCGRDVRHLSYSERRKLLVKVVAMLNSPNIHVIGQITHTEIEKRFMQIVRSGGEGVVIKDIRSPYGVNWAKMKKVYDVSFIVTGVTPGKNQYADTIGSLRLSVLKDGVLTEFGKCSGFSNVDRIRIGDNVANYIGRVVDVFVQEMAVRRVRSATFHRFRDDVNPRECTYEKLIADMQPEKAKWTRKKRRGSE